MGKAKSAIKSQEEALRRALDFIREVASRCIDRGFRLEGAFIVGSRARGDYLEDSDVDLVLLIGGVEELNRLERLDLIKDLLLPRIEVFIYTPQEWRESDSLWLKELKREAKTINP
ncbi:MAG: nucleotidyltransferase domain-containing protein [Thermoproteota archaeon]